METIIQDLCGEIGQGGYSGGRTPIPKKKKKILHFFFYLVKRLDIHYEHLKYNGNNKLSHGPYFEDLDLSLFESESALMFLR